MVNKAPRCVRNFWVELEVDGKKTKVKTGPRSSSGGIYLQIYMRNKGHVEKVLEIIGTKIDRKILSLSIKNIDDGVKRGSSRADFTIVSET